MKVKLQEIMSIICWVLDEVNEGNHDWIIDNYEVEEDEAMRNYSFTLGVRKFVKEDSEVEELYMNWNLEATDSKENPLLHEPDMGEIVVEWKELQKFFTPYIWDNIILFFLVQGMSEYNELGLTGLSPEDYYNLSTDTLAMYDNYMTLKDEYIYAIPQEQKRIIN